MLTCYTQARRNLEERRLASGPSDDHQDHRGTKANRSDSQARRSENRRHNRDQRCPNSWTRMNDVDGVDLAACDGMSLVRRVRVGAVVVFLPFDHTWAPRSMFRTVGTCCVLASSSWRFSILTLDVWIWLGLLANRLFRPSRSVWVTFRIHVGGPLS